MPPAHPYDALVRLWWWVRGVTEATYTMCCGRCGHNGRLHLLGCGCRRFVKPAPQEETR
jgi:hypothetical protein